MTSLQRQQVTSPSASPDLLADDVDVDQPSRTTYAPVQKSVQIVSDRLKSSARIQSALSLAASYLPQRVTDLSIAGAGRLQELGSTYATPLVARVDDKISNAVATILAAPAYGQAKVVAVDATVFSYTPELLKPTYTRTRTRTIEIVQGATERVVQLKRQRGDPLFESLKEKLSEVQKRITQLRAAVSELGHNAKEHVHALSQLERLNELHAKINQAVELARAKGQQVKSFGENYYHAAQEAATNLTLFVESNLTEQQSAAVRAFWSRLLDAVSLLKETLHISTVQAETSEEGVPLAQPVSAVPAHVSVAAAVSAIEPNSNGIAHYKLPPHTNGEEGDNAHNNGADDTTSNNGAVSNASAKKKGKKKRSGSGNAQQETQPDEGHTE